MKEEPRGICEVSMAKFDTLSWNLHEGTEENKKSHDTIAGVLVRIINGQHFNTNLKTLQPSAQHLTHSRS
jgi:hypothetical protein